LKLKKIDSSDILKICRGEKITTGGEYNLLEELASPV
jgi:hypothetical protein